MTPPSTATAVTTLAPDTLRSPYLAANDEQGFIDELLEGQPDAHAYFGRMKRENRQGPVVMGERTPLQELDTAAVARDLAEDKVTFIDARSHSEVHEGTVTGSLNIPAGKSVASYGAWSVNPASDKTRWCSWPRTRSRPRTCGTTWSASASTTSLATSPASKACQSPPRG